MDKGKRDLPEGVNVGRVGSVCCRSHAAAFCNGALQGDGPICCSQAVASRRQAKFEVRRMVPCSLSWAPWFPFHCINSTNLWLQSDVGSQRHHEHVRLFDCASRLCRVVPRENLFVTGKEPSRSGGIITKAS